MRIPPYFYSRSFQRFFSGVVIGAIISWLIFLYMFGRMQEEQVKVIRQQEELIADLEKEKNIWQEDFKKLNEKNKELLTVQDISIKITNGSKYKIDALSIFEVQEKVKEDISNVLAKDLHVVYTSKDLLEKVIENKPVVINERRYQLTVRKMVIYTTLNIELELTLAQ